MRFYSLFLRLYPASFRAEYGEEMRAVFARRRAQAGALGAVWLWGSAICDTAVNAASVHLDILRQDSRFLVRSLRKSPGFAVTAIAAAALGVGATTAAFTIVDNDLIRPLPFPQSNRLVELFEDHSNRGIREFDVSPATFRDWKAATASFQSLGAYRGLSVNLVGEGEPQRLDGAAVTGDIFPTLGVSPLLGRYIDPQDDADSAPETVVLSYGLWQDLFGGDAGVLGRKLLLDGTAFTVVGVMPRGFYFPGGDHPELWTPQRFRPENFEDRLDAYLYGIGRLKPGVSLEQARAEFRAIAAGISRAYPKEMGHTGATLLGLREGISPQARTLLKALLWASLCVLLIACLNLANLLLARALGRRKELAVRAALGAGGERLVRQTLTESIFLALAGGALGVLLAGASLPLLARLAPVNLPTPQTPTMDLRVLGFALAVTFLTGIAFGVVPALRVARGMDAAGLREGARGGIGGHSEHLRRALVAAEICGCMVLMVGAGLMLRAMWRIQNRDPGFRADHLLTLRTTLPIPKYENAVSRDDFYDRVVAGARQIPGVTGAAYISFLPMVNRGGVWPVSVPERAEDPSSRRNASLRFITPGFFATMQIPLREGRDVSEGDTPDTPFVAVVSQSFARTYWPGRDAIGRHFQFGNHDRMVIGVVGDIRVRGLVQQSEPQVYLPYKQHVSGVATWYAPKDLVVRTSGAPTNIAPALRRIIHAADPDQPVSDLRTMEEIVAEETALRAVQVRVLGVFAGIALLLAAVGIHGLLSFAISSRTQEIGVRMALGASRARVMGIVLREALMLALAGTAVGVVLAPGVGRYLASVLAGLEAWDAPTYGVAAAVTMGIALVGSLMAARRAGRIDPVRAIRGE